MHVLAAASALVALLGLRCHNQTAAIFGACSQFDFLVCRGSLCVADVSEGGSQWTNATTATAPATTATAAAATAAVRCTCCSGAAVAVPATAAAPFTSGHFIFKGHVLWRPWYCHGTGSWRVAGRAQQRWRPVEVGVGSERPEEGLCYCPLPTGRSAAGIATGKPVFCCCCICCC